MTTYKLSELLQKWHEIVVKAKNAGDGRFNSPDYPQVKSEFEAFKHVLGEYWWLLKFTDPESGDWYFAKETNWTVVKYCSDNQAIHKLYHHLTQKP